MPPGEIPPPTADDSPEPQGGGIELPAGVELPPDSGALMQPEVKYGTWEEIQSVAKSSGRITVVDLWSLACEPCLKEFPGLVRLHQSFGSSVQCIAVDIDFDGRKTRPPEHYEERVIAFLRSVGAAGFPTFISQTPSDEVYAATKLASIPAVLIYSAEGEIVKVFVDAGETVGFTYEKDVIPLVTELAG
jgi:thiol-disulfide isomerase/thioredoxin